MPLSIDDKQEVLEALFLARDKWRFIGGALGLKDDGLRCIATEESEVGERLDRVIARWLHNGVNCTWEAVAAALRNVTVSRADLAEEVERKYQIRSPVPPVPPPQPAGAQDKELTKDDLSDVAGYLRDLSKTHLRTLGLVLGLTPNTVDDTFQGTSVADYRHSILEAWLMRQDKVEDKGIPSWRVLAGALEDKQLGQNGIARKIRSDKQL